MNDPKICILLTACINPKDCLLLNRSDPKVREQDYVKSLRFWIKKKDCSIIFCDNSGHDLTKIKKIAEKARKNGRQIEILQFEGNSYPRELGKGYGEMLIISYAAEHSRLFKQASHIVKVTGRYIVKNIREVIRSLRDSDDFDVVSSRPRLGLSWVDSIIFVSKPTFIQNYLLKYRESINDSKKFYFENALYQAINDSEKSGLKCLSFKVMPFIRGYSATHNLFINGADSFSFTVNRMLRLKEFIRRTLPNPIIKFLKKFRRKK